MHLPVGFSWVVKGELAAMGRPHGRRDFERLKDAGIGQIITLTRDGLREPLVREFGFDYLHLPVEDFRPPTLEQVEAFVNAVAAARRRGVATVVHCLSGKGRTGTMLACYLVAQGRSAEEAIGEVRALRPGSIETPEQEDMVRQYARRTRGPRST